jgi:hypothetical protein
VLSAKPEWASNLVVNAEHPRVPAISFDLAIFLLGTFAAAFVTGLAGFAFGMVAAGIWLFALERAIIMLTDHRFWGHASGPHRQVI